MNPPSRQGVVRPKEESSAQKRRKGGNAAEAVSPAAKSLKATNNNQSIDQAHHQDSTQNHGLRQNNRLQINYLARLHPEDIPLISANDSMPNALALLNRYHDVLERSESLASNLGARPLSSVLIGSFERMFDSPSPRILQHPAVGINVDGAIGDDGRGHVTWLDVVEHAANHPDRFLLTQLRNGDGSEGPKVCQFYCKYCKVQISEHDWTLVHMGMPQKMIPPQPIAEDEEKELGTLEILEKSVRTITALADQVAARARQFNHSVQARKQAIIERRSAETGVSSATVLQGSSDPSLPGFVDDSDFSGSLRQPSQVVRSQSPLLANPASSSALNATNQRKGSSNTHNTTKSENPSDQPSLRHLQGLSQQAQPVTQRGTLTTSNPSTVSPQTRTDLLKSFTTITDRQNAAEASCSAAAALSHHHPAAASNNSARPTPFPNTPNTASASFYDSNVHSMQQHHPPSQTPEPFKANMVARLDVIPRGHPIAPPCDRCRRLRIDCVKNLTACSGCTKKHAKCSWRNVSGDEMGAIAQNYFGDSGSNGWVGGANNGMGGAAAVTFMDGAVASAGAHGTTEMGIGGGHLRVAENGDAEGERRVNMFTAGEVIDHEDVDGQRHDAQP